MVDQQSAADSSHCFVCGPHNAVGMRIAFRLEQGKCCAEFTPAEHYCGFDGITHGGILFSLLDDAMANWLYLQGDKAYTAKCEVRYREPAPIGARYTVEAEQLARKGRAAKMAARVVHQQTGRVVAEATATFFVMAE